LTIACGAFIIIHNNSEKDGGMIIDSHVHVGASVTLHTEVELSHLLNAMETNHVDKAIVQPLPGAYPSSEKVHEVIHAMCKKYEGQFYGLISISPFLPLNQVEDEVKRCVEEFGFVGIKLHTFGHNVNPLSPEGDLIFQLAEQYKLVVNVHTGNGSFGNPCLIIPKAKEYENVSIVLAHSGMQYFATEAQVVASQHQNVYLETSWSQAEYIDGLVSSLGSNRIMFGSDVYTSNCYNLAVELEKYRVLDISNEDKNNCLSNTAAIVFGL